MARRKTEGPELSLFPFLSVLAAVMGTLILVISGMSQIALASPKQRVDVERFDPGKKSPIYVECARTGLYVHPDDPTGGAEGAGPVFVHRDRIADDPTSAWHAVKTRLAIDPTRYVMFLVRADGIATFTAAHDAAVATGADVAYEPLFGDGDVRFVAKRGGP
jgi:hypothetical protein